MKLIRWMCGISLISFQSFNSPEILIQIQFLTAHSTQRKSVSIKYIIHNHHRALLYDIPRVSFPRWFSGSESVGTG